MDLKVLKNLDFLKNKKFKKQQGYTIYMLWQMFLIFFFAFFVVGVVASVLVFSYTTSGIEDPATYVQTFDTTKVDSIAKKLDLIESSVKARSGDISMPTSQNQ